MKNELKLKEFLPYRLSVLSNRISRDIAKRYQERFSLTIPEWRVMAILGETPGLSASQVGEKTAMDKVAVSRAAAGLLAAKLIARKTDSADKRKVVLSLSKKGRKKFGKTLPFVGLESKDSTFEITMTGKPDNPSSYKFKAL